MASREKHAQWFIKPWSSTWSIWVLSTTSYQHKLLLIIIFTIWACLNTCLYLININKMQPNSTQNSISTPHSLPPLNAKEPGLEFYTCTVETTLWDADLAAWPFKLAGKLNWRVTCHNRTTREGSARHQYTCPHYCFFLHATSMAFSPHTLHNMQTATKHPDSSSGHGY